MKFKYPKYIVDAFTKDDWYNALVISKVNYSGD